MLDFQLYLEDKYSKKLIPNKIWNEVHDIDLLSQFDNEKEARAILTAVLMKNREQPIQNFVSVVSSQGFSWKESVDLMEKYADKDIYEITQYASGKLAVVPMISLDNSTLNSFEDTTVLPPLVIKPKEWTDNFNGGYMTIKHSCILGSQNQHKEYQALDVLNKLQSIKWKLNTTVLTNFHDPVCYSTSKEVDIQATLLDKPFYFMWQFDKRGRMYSKGYEINIQSTEYHKALLDFNMGEILSNEGYEALMVSLANSAGYDKLLWDDRIAKGTALIAERVTVNEEGVEIDTADLAEPILFTKYVEAYLDSLEGKRVYAPASLDCTASGLQIMSVLTGCILTAKHTNIINIGKRADVYTAIVNHMNDMLDEENYVDRDTVKQPLMTYFYNSTACPEATFNSKQLEAFYDAIEGEFTGPNHLMELINEKVWSDKDTYQWTLPDGHVAVVRTFVKETATVGLDEGIEFDYDYAVHQANGNHRHLVPNIIHSIDAYVARELVRRCDFEVACIHDSFWCHPNNMWEMARTFKEILIELANSNVLNDILSEIAGRPIKFEKLSDNLAELMESAEYILS